MKARLALAPLAAAGCLVAATAASAAPAPAQTTTPTGVTAKPTSHDQLAFAFEEVVSGTVRAVPGNQHQLYLVRNGAGERTVGFLRSWSCPSGARVTPTWASSRCTHRMTQDLRERASDPNVGWISSTGRSGRLGANHLVGVNRATGWKRLLDTNLRFRAADDATLDAGTGPDGAYGTWSSAKITGSITDAPIWVRTSTGDRFGWQE